MSEEGIVKWFSVEKGYGFIVRDRGVDVFVHHTAIIGEPKTLREGERVTFGISESPKGLQAMDVTRLD